MRKSLLILLMLLCLVSAIAVYAGWMHVPDRPTMWTPNPTPISLWRRDNVTDDVFPATKVLIYDDTVKWVAGISTTILGSAYNTGYWEMDANGDVSPSSNLTGAVYSNRLAPGGWQDVEWNCDENGDVSPKP